MLSEIENFEIKTLDETNYIEPVMLHYRQGEVEKRWEAVKSHESVAVLLYHKTKRAFVVVKQFRAPVYMHHAEHPCTYELCAGIVDKEASLKQIAKEEIDEECGYDVPLGDIHEITSFFTNVGISGAQQSLFFAMVDEEMQVHDGGGIHDEEIVVEYILVEQCKAFIYDTSKAKTPGLMFAFYWFLENYPELA
ncbi:MAG TPA: NUDIX hydrolase [Campylobacterales bacterium]|nr:NUDIX hydrolase [Campylobacterales bacterium]